MKETKLSGSVNNLHVYIDKGKQKASMKAIKERKRAEQKQINLERWKNELN